MKICFIDGEIFVDKPGLLDALKDFGEVTVFSGIPKDTEEVVRRAKDADVIAFGLMQFTHEMLNSLPNLKLLQFIGTGAGNFVDVDYAESRGIKVLNIDGYGSNAVAEFAVTVSLALAKKIYPAVSVVKSGRWSLEDLMGKEIKDSTVGVVGTGSIGALVSEKFAALGADVIACDIFENKRLKDDYGIKYKSVDEVFAEADIVTLHMKVTKENERMIDRKLLSLMKKGALLINVARAELVNTKDLYQFLKEGRIGGAAIDVYDREPPSETDYKLASLPNVIATPHMAYYTQQANDNSIVMTVNSIMTHLRETI